MKKIVRQILRDRCKGETLIFKIIVDPAMTKMFERFHTHLDFDNFQEKSILTFPTRYMMSKVIFEKKRTHDFNFLLNRRFKMRPSESLYDLFLQNYINLYYRQFFIVTVMLFTVFLFAKITNT